MKRLERAPAHLSDESRKLWAETVKAFALEPHELKLLRLLCEALDRGDEARQVLAVEGAYVDDRYGSRRAHPAVAVERDSRLAAARLVSALAFEKPAKPVERHRAPDRIRRIV